MELSSITDKLVHQARHSQIEQITAVTKALGLKVGSQFLADVQKVTQATPEERGQLLKAIEANLIQLNKNSAAPAIKALIDQLEAQKNIAQHPSLKLVTLMVTTTAPPGTTITQALPATSLLTYTNQPLQVGQTLLMQLSEGQKLQVLQPLTKAELTSVSALLHTGNPGSLTSVNAPQANSNPIAADSRLALTKAAEAIGESLRYLLPQKDKGQDLLASLPKITQFIQQLPLAERQEWLSSQVQQALKTLANHIRLSDQLANPKLLEMALKNNGQSFEQKLAQLVTRQQANEPLPPATESKPAAEKKSIGAAALTPSTGINSLLLKDAGSAAIPHRTGEMQQYPVDKLAKQDLKGALLSLLHELDTELETAKSTLPGSLLATEPNKNPLAIALPPFLGMLINKQQNELSQKQLRTQLILLMHQYTLGSIAKIQLQQLHSLNHQLAQSDQTQPTPSWQFEIPVRQGQEVHPLHIQIEQQWVDDHNEKEEKNRTRVRQWNVMLHFDLPVIGQFYAQLNLLGEKLSAKFWAENEDTLAEAKIKMDGLKNQLERNDIHVTQMQCVPGLPPKRKMSFSYSLVDIKT